MVLASTGVLSNDTDVEGNTLTAIKVEDPSNGTLTMNSDGSFTYTPSTNFNGMDSFTYKVNDGALDFEHGDGDFDRHRGERCA